MLEPPKRPVEVVHILAFFSLIRKCAKRQSFWIHWTHFSKFFSPFQPVKNMVLKSGRFHYSRDILHKWDIGEDWVGSTGFRSQVLGAWWTAGDSGPRCWVGSSTSRVDILGSSSRGGGCFLSSPTHHFSATSSEMWTEFLQQNIERCHKLIN